jgi:predicted RNase H-like HicB family nuclease
MRNAEWLQRRMAYYVAILDGAGDVWGVRIPDLPGCYGGGATPETAITDATSAAREWAADAIPDGQQLPPPRRVQEVIADPRAEFDPASGESLVMIPLVLDAIAAS